MSDHTQHPCLSDHTQEPWCWRRLGGQWMLTTVHGGAQVVLTCARSGMQGAAFRLRDDGTCSLVEFDPEHPDARRITACVNACAGLSTEGLEADGLPALLHALREFLLVLPPTADVYVRRRAAALGAAIDLLSPPEPPTKPAPPTNDGPEAVTKDESAP